MDNHTSNNVALTRAANVALKPEWLRIPAAVGYSGIGRSSLYSLIGENKIRSAVVKKRGNVKGIRVVSVASIDDYLNGLADVNTPADSTTELSTQK